MGVICREFSRESQLNNNCKTLFHSTGVTPEGDIISCINLPENSTLIPRFTAILNDAAGDAKRAKKMYVDSLAPGTVRAIVLLCYTWGVCAKTTSPPSVSHQRILCLQIKSIFDARNLFLSWHKEVKVGAAVTFPLQELDIKAFCVACAKAGFTYKRIIENFFCGLCMWVSGLQKTYWLK